MSSVIVKPLLVSLILSKLNLMVLFLDSKSLSKDTDNLWSVLLYIWAASVERTGLAEDNLDTSQ